MKTRLLLLIALLVIGMSAFPALAQENPVNTVAFNGFSFSFSPPLAQNVNIVQVHDDQMTFPMPAPHTEFLLYNELPAPFSFTDATAAIYVFPTADMAQFVDHTSQLQALQALLEEQADLSPYMTIMADGSDAWLPFLPLFPAGQVIRARAHYVETPALSGISFVTVYAQVQEPFLSDQFMATFQGVSADGAYYVSAIMRLHTDLFPTEPDPGFTVLELQADVPGYMNASIAALNEALPSDFTPSLNLLDDLVQTFRFETGS